MKEKKNMSEDNKTSKPRISNKLKKEITTTIAKIENIIRHIKNVQDNCLLLGTRLIENGDVLNGKRLIANGFIHDNSKFYGNEWEHLNIIPVNSIDLDPIKLKRNLSINHHRTTNSHHPEYWGGIKNMPQIFVAEMICDWKSRSEEFGTSLRDWIKNDATKTWEFDEKDQIYKDIMYYVDILCEKPFEQITEN